MNQEQARTEAQRLFNRNLLFNRGQGFWLYIENIENELVSRKGLEHCASDFTGEKLTLLTRNDEQTYPEFKLGKGIRSTVLQLTHDYERDQERLIAAKARKLERKFNK